ncbi:hypothetical protein ACH429_07195 [Streptomyces pathocidini]|uniref:Integral membrane protein n=1 Tax=Streptomyces pathocidini TaxID=1650571 RepID=A0ABW7UMM7_9ACTN|nr:hypothetical protein [Streptomyces pathocidini]
MSSEQNETGAGSPAETTRSAEAGPEADGPRPARLTAAAVLSGVEGVALAAFGAYLLVMGLLGAPDSAEQAEMGGLTLLALAALPLVAARGLLLRRRWSRGPALIIQIMAVPVAWTLISTGGVVALTGIALAAVALAVLGLIVNPTATAALDIAPR